MKIKFNSDDDLPLNKLLKFHLTTIIIRCVFSEDGKLYPQLLWWYFVWIIKMLQYEKIDVSEGIDVNKTSVSKECELFYYWFFKDVGFKFEDHICNRCNDLLIMTYSLKKYSDIERKRSYFFFNEALKKLNNSVTYDREVL